MGTVTLAGQNIHDATMIGGRVRLYVDEADRPMGEIELSTTDYAGKDGSVLDGQWHRCPEITLGVWAVGGTLADRRNALRRALLLGEETGAVRLQFSDDGDFGYEVMRSSSVQTADHIDSTYAQVTYRSMWPWLLGNRVSVTVPSDGTSVRFDYNGNMASPLVVRGYSLAPTSAGKIDVYVQGRRLTATANDAAAVRNYVIDGEKKSTLYCQVPYGAVWPHVEPDRVVQPTTVYVKLVGGGGNATFSVQERRL